MRQAAIIIPFYQEERGILAKAISSALEQVLPPDVALWLIIIDDLSPVPADTEMAAITIPDHVSVTIHRVAENGGPGAARNIGLDLACAEGAAFCAFLDSDDTWIGPHLANAITMLDRGTDAYFSDHRRVGDFESAFESGAPQFWNSPTVRHAREAAGPDGSTQLFEVDADFVRNSLVHEYVFQTSTVAFSLDTVGAVRFDTRLRSAGEDHLFWFDLASAGRRFAVSAGVEVECGFGVNIYFDNFSWKSPRAVERYGYRYLMFQEMMARGVTGALEQLKLRQDMANMRNTYVYLLVRHLFRGNWPDWALFRRVLSAALGYHTR